MEDFTGGVYHDVFVVAVGEEEDVLEEAETGVGLAEVFEDGVGGGRGGGWVLGEGLGLGLGLGLGDEGGEEEFERGVLAFDIGDGVRGGDELVEGAFVEGDDLVHLDIDVRLLVPLPTLPFIPHKMFPEKADDLPPHHLIPQHTIILINKLPEPQIQHQRHPVLRLNPPAPLLLHPLHPHHLPLITNNRVHLILQQPIDRPNRLHKKLLDIQP